MTDQAAISLQSSVRGEDWIRAGEAWMRYAEEAEKEEPERPERARLALTNALQALELALTRPDVDIAKAQRWRARVACALGSYETARDALRGFVNARENEVVESLESSLPVVVTSHDDFECLRSDRQQWAEVYESLFELAPSPPRHVRGWVQLPYDDEEGHVRVYICEDDRAYAPSFVGGDWQIERFGRAQIRDGALVIDFDLACGIGEAFPGEPCERIDEKLTLLDPLTLRALLAGQARRTLTFPDGDRRPRSCTGPAPGEPLESVP